MRKLLASFLFCFLVLPRMSLASEVFLEAGLHFGGDTIRGFALTSGSEEIKAGELLSASVGMIGDVDDEMEFRASIGLKLDAITAINGEADFTRFPLELMLFTRNESVNFGLGLSYHLDPEYTEEGSFFGGNFTMQFDDAVGVVAEMDIKFSTGGYVGLKATFIDYEAGPIEFDGNSLGVVIGIRF